METAQEGELAKEDNGEEGENKDAETEEEKDDDDAEKDTYNGGKEDKNDDDTEEGDVVIEDATVIPTGMNHKIFPPSKMSAVTMYVVKHPFNGNPTQSLLSFPICATIQAQPVKAVYDGEDRFRVKKVGFLQIM
eukprot:12029479-Ditylum_brightwellii.AAC.1